MRSYRPPVVVFNKSHSGSRLLAQLLHHSGISMGSPLNESWDSLAVLEVVEHLVTRYYPDFSPLWRTDLAPDAQLQRLLMSAFASHCSGIDAGAAWGWKLCETTYILPVIDYCFPEARYVHLIRDGRDVAFSDHRGPDTAFWRKVYFNTDRVRECYGLRLSARAYRRSPHLYNALHWINSVRVGRDFGAMLRDRYIEVRYEHLCSDFEAVSARLLSAVGAPHADVAIAQYRGGVSSASVGKHRRQSARTLSRVIEMQKPLLLELGYLTADTATTRPPFRLGSAIDDLAHHWRRASARRPRWNVAPALRRSIWVHGDTPQQFTAALPSIQALMDSRPHTALVATSSHPRTRLHLRAMFPDERPLALPSAQFASSWMARINAQHLIALDGGHSLDAGWQRAIAARTLPLTAIDTNSPDAMASQFASLDRVLPQGPALPPVAQDWRADTWRDRVGRSHAWRVASRLVAGGRIDSVGGLSRALGEPHRILCLGNGPGSEDPLVQALGHDCLMRVNWRWMERRILTRPQMVFVGDPVTLEKVDGAIFGIWNCDLERGMLLRHLRVRGLRTMRHFTMERTCPIIRDRDWPARPSNGALMVAAAAALEPDELMIAGIDLFKSPLGRYPGDPVGTNAYSRVHTRDTDVAVIREALGAYRGKVTIIGDALRDALDASGAGSR
jgi:hypothetical protein